MQKRKIKRLFLLSFLGLCLILLPLLEITGTTTPDEPPITVTMDNYYLSLTEANYYSLDDDGFEDDIITACEFGTITGYNQFFDIMLLEYVELPSGLTYYIVYSIQGYFSSFEMVSDWHNIATESGWYEFGVIISVNQFYDDIILDSCLVFDPPEGPEGGDPWITTSITPG
ncbi:MAG: hypothetical protein U9O98_10965 [Asgard group archaeon]|nr:hypothetical protein [Asgard group archaeon]